MESVEQLLDIHQASRQQSQAMFTPSEVGSAMPHRPCSCGQAVLQEPPSHQSRRSRWTIGVPTNKRPPDQAPLLHGIGQHSRSDRSQLSKKKAREGVSLSSLARASARTCKKPSAKEDGVSPGTAAKGLFPPGGCTKLNRLTQSRP